jgi:hypothetical protein
MRLALWLGVFKKRDDGWQITDDRCWTVLIDFLVPKLNIDEKLPAGARFLRPGGTSCR